jgi:hypothetical protein
VSTFPDITPHPITGLYDIGETRTARTLGFMGPVLVTEPLWYVCIWRAGQEPRWRERINELLTSLRQTLHKTENEDNTYIVTFTPDFEGHWQPLAATMGVADGKLEYWVTLLAQAKRMWPDLNKAPWKLGR